MNFDKPLVAILIGAIATIPFEIFMRIAKSLGLVKYSLYQLDSIVITSNRPVALLGFIVSSIVGGFIAFILYYALPKIGTDYLVIKSTLFSLFAWSALEVVLTLGFEGTKVPLRPIVGYYIQMVGAIIFGIIIGLLFKKYLLKQTA